MTLDWVTERQKLGDEMNKIPTLRMTDREWERLRRHVRRTFWLRRLCLAVAVLDVITACFYALTGEFGTVAWCAFMALVLCAEGRRL